MFCWKISGTVFPISCSRTSILKIQSLIVSPLVSHHKKEKWQCLFLFFLRNGKPTEKLQPIFQMTKAMKIWAKHHGLPCYQVSESRHWCCTWTQCRYFQAGVYLSPLVRPEARPAQEHKIKFISPGRTIMSQTIIIVHRFICWSLQITKVTNKSMRRAIKKKFKHNACQNGFSFLTTPRHVISKVQLFRATALLRYQCTELPMNITSIELKVHNLDKKQN